MEFGRISFQTSNQEALKKGRRNSRTSCVRRIGAMKQTRELRKALHEDRGLKNSFTDGCGTDAKRCIKKAICQYSRN